MMNSSRVKKTTSDSSSSSSNAPITIQVQVPGANDGSISNNHLVPQQDCPSFSGECVLNGAFKKISNMVNQKIKLGQCFVIQSFRHFLENILCYCSILWTGLLSVQQKLLNSQTKLRSFK